tara:strand:+ start:111 stop:692 length:582 start_codon:yes stop_codon:yes gene_type:complete
MLNFYKIIEIIISLQIIIISTFVPIFITFPFTNKLISTFEIPITWQVPSIIIITLIFNGKIVTKAFSIYLILGLFFIPVFYKGGSLGYLLTPNFGYLLGIFPLIKIIDNLSNKNKKIKYIDFLKYGILGISSMHLIGIVYTFIQLFYFKKLDILIYSIAKYSLGKFGYHLLMLTPITLLIKLINNKYQNNVKS